MEDGFVPDAGHGNLTRLSTWIAGEPKGSFWGGLKTSDRRGYYLESLRCVQCGFVELYARHPLND